MAAFAFALPILPGQEETIRRLSEEVSGSGPLRRAYEESRRSLGITEEKVWLQQTPIGEMAIVYWETEDPQRVLREMADSPDEFDSRFRRFIQSVAPVLNLTQGQPLSNELLLEWPPDEFSDNWRSETVRSCRDFSRIAIEEKRRELVAYHEAGHAVAAHLLGIEVENVSIVEDEGGLGRSKAPLPEDFDPHAEGAEEVMKSHLIAGVAGAASEELLTGELSSLTGNDLAGTAKLLMSLAGIGAHARENGEQALERAKSILRDNWGSVQVLAEALLEHGELDRQQIRAVLDRGASPR